MENKCCYCEGPISQERVDIGYFHCTENICLARFHTDWRSNMRLVLVPKQGFAIVHKNEMLYLQNGKSSGK